MCRYCAGCLHNASSAHRAWFHRPCCCSGGDNVDPPADNRQACGSTAEWDAKGGESQGAAEGVTGAPASLELAAVESSPPTVAGVRLPFRERPRQISDAENREWLRQDPCL